MKKFIEDNMEFFNELEPLEKEQMLNSIIVKSIKKGEIIMDSDSGCVGMMMIKKGEIRTYIVSEEGKEVTLFNTKTPKVCVLSTSCILNSITFDICSEAIEDTEILIVPSKVVADIMEKNIQFKVFVLNRTIERFSDVVWTMEQIMFFSLDERLAAFLIDEYNRTNSTKIAMTHEKISRYISSSREVVSRGLKYFENSKIVKLSRGYIDIIDIEKLRNIIN